MVMAWLIACMVIVGLAAGRIVLRNRAQDFVAGFAIVERAAWREDELELELREGSKTVIAAQAMNGLRWLEGGDGINGSTYVYGFQLTDAQGNLSAFLGEAAPAMQAVREGLTQRGFLPQTTRWRSAFSYETKFIARRLTQRQGKPESL